MPKKKSNLSAILGSKNKFKVMESLSGYNEKAQAIIEKETGMYKSHTSRTLKELEQIDAVKCTNPDDRSYKFYMLKQKGKILFKKAKEIKETIKK